MLRLPRFKLLVLSAAVALASLAGASVALATTSSGSQNSNVTVTASLTSNGAYPDQAGRGDVVTAAASETNNTAAREGLRVTYTLAYPDGRVFTTTKQLNLAAGETQNQARTYTVDAADPRGTYTYTVSATDKNGTSTTTATIVVS